MEIIDAESESMQHFNSQYKLFSKVVDPCPISVVLKNLFWVTSSIIYDTYKFHNFWHPHSDTNLHFYEHFHKLVDIMYFFSEMDVHAALLIFLLSVCLCLLDSLNTLRPYRCHVQWASFSISFTFAITLWNCLKLIFNEFNFTNLSSHSSSPLLSCHTILPCS